MASASNRFHVNPIAILPSCLISFDPDISDEISNHSQESLVEPSPVPIHRVLLSYLSNVLLCHQGVTQVEFASKIAYIIMIITGVMVFCAVSVVVFMYKLKRYNEVLTAIVIISAVIVVFYLLMAFYFLGNCLLQACGYIRSEDEILPIPDPSTLYQSTPTLNNYELLGHGRNSKAKNSSANNTTDFSTFSTEFFW